MIAIIQSYCLIYPPVFIKPYQCSLMPHTVIQLVWGHLLDKSVLIIILILIIQSKVMTQSYGVTVYSNVDDK